MQKVRDLKFHRPLLSDAELQFLMDLIAEKHHRLKVVAEMLEEDLKELDRRTDITQLSNIEIIETDFDDLEKKTHATKLEVIKLWDEMSILGGYYLRFERMLNGRAEKGGQLPWPVKSARDDVHLRWWRKPQREQEPEKEP